MVLFLKFIEKRGQSVYSHRRKSSGYISGTIRYEVLKRAKFRCELCGISAAEKALEVDHILLLPKATVPHITKEDHYDKLSSN